MMLDELLLPVMSLVIAVTAPEMAAAQQRRHAVTTSGAAQQTADMRSRIAAAIDRVRVAAQHGKVVPARSAALRRQLGQAQRDLANLSRRQGTVGTAELARYDHLVTRVDTELSGNASMRSYGNDALPSAEMLAFDRVDARLHYRNARIEYDDQECALYQGTAPDGRLGRERLRNSKGQPICTRH